MGLRLKMIFTPKPPVLIWIYPIEGDIKENHLLLPLPLLLSSRKFSFLNCWVSSSDLHVWPGIWTSHPALHLFCFQSNSEAVDEVPFVPCFFLFSSSIRKWWVVPQSCLDLCSVPLGKRADSAPWLGRQDLGPLLQEVHQLFLRRHIGWDLENLILYFSFLWT